MKTKKETDDFYGAFSPAAFCKAYSVGLTFLYEQIKKKKLRARKAGSKTLILRRDAEAWAESLPEMST